MGAYLELATGEGFASEAGGFFDAFFFGLGGPIVPRFSEGGIFASEVNSGYGVGWDDLGDGIFAMHDEEVNLARVLIVAENKADDFLTVVQVEGNVSAVVEGGLESVLAGGRIGAGERGVLDRTWFMRGKCVFIGLGHKRRGRLTVGSGSVSDGSFDRAGESWERAEGVVDRAGLVSAVHHAVAALHVATFLPIIFPHGIGHELLEGGDVAVLQEVAGFLPTEDVIGGVAPGGAIVVDVALEELEEVRGEIKLPRFFAAFENFLEEFFGAFAT